MSVSQVFGLYYFHSLIVTRKSYRQLLLKYFFPLQPSPSPDKDF